MHSLLTGFVAGALSGFVMGVVSQILYHANLFRSSLIVIDGTFFFRTLKRQGNPPLIAGAGMLIHLVTSGVFGAIYFVVVRILGITEDMARSFLSVGLYVAILWLSMLFIALPVAGESVLGRKSGPFSWLEQFILHVIFCLLYYLLLNI